MKKGKEGQREGVFQIYLKTTYHIQVFMNEDNKDEVKVDCKAIVNEVLLYNLVKD